MPTEQPSNAPDDLTPRDEATEGAAIADDRLDATPGGGTLTGAGGAAPHHAGGGTAPNAPIDVPVPGVADGGAIEHEAAVQAAGDATKGGRGDDRG